MMKYTAAKTHPFKKIRDGSIWFLEDNTIVRVHKTSWFYHRALCPLVAYYKLKEKKKHLIIENRFIFLTKAELFL